MKTRKALAIFMAIAMVFCYMPATAFADVATDATEVMVDETLLPTYGAGAVTLGGGGSGPLDMPRDGFWSTAALRAAVSNGLLNGFEEADGTYIRPNDPLTRAQMAAIINRVFRTTEISEITGVTDVPEGAWYFRDIQKAVRMGTMMLDTRMRPNDSITRQEAFTILARALKLKAGARSDFASFGDASQVASWATSGLGAMVRAGYVIGNNNLLNPTAIMTRAQFAFLMNTLILKGVLIIGSDLIETDDAVIPAAGGGGGGGGGGGTPPATVEEYGVGEWGQAGWIFYDKGFYKDGWRYLEAAPAITEWLAPFNANFGTMSILDTSQDIGTGMDNTITIVEKLGENGDDGDNGHKNYAAKLCLDLEHDGKDDWFLPSRFEANAMYNNLYLEEIGEFSSSPYWSSSQLYRDPAQDKYYAWTGKPSDLENNYVNFKSSPSPVRAVRAIPGVDVTSITVTGAGNATTIATDGGTLLMSANVQPDNASNREVTWSVTSIGGRNGDGPICCATIDENGLLNAVADGSVAVVATAKDGTGKYGNAVITISNQSPKIIGANVDITTGSAVFTYTFIDNYGEEIGYASAQVETYDLDTSESTVRIERRAENNVDVLNATGNIYLDAVGIIPGTGIATYNKLYDINNAFNVDFMDWGGVPTHVILRLTTGIEGSAIKEVTIPLMEDDKVALSTLGEMPNQGMTEISATIPESPEEGQSFTFTVDLRYRDNVAVRGLASKYFELRLVTGAGSVAIQGITEEIIGEEPTGKYTVTATYNNTALTDNENITIEVYAMLEMVGRFGVTIKMPAPPAP